MSMSALDENDLLALGAMYELIYVCGENNATGRTIDWDDGTYENRSEVGNGIVMVLARAVCLVELL